MSRLGSPIDLLDDCLKPNVRKIHCVCLLLTNSYILILHGCDTIEMFYFRIEFQTFHKIAEKSNSPKNQPFFFSGSFFFFSVSGPLLPDIGCRAFSTSASRRSRSRKRQSDGTGWYMATATGSVANSGLPRVFWHWFLGHFKTHFMLSWVALKAMKNHLCPFWCLTRWLWP